MRTIAMSLRKIRKNTLFKDFLVVSIVSFIILFQLLQRTEVSLEYESPNTQLQTEEDGSEDEVKGQVNMEDLRPAEHSRVEEGTKGYRAVQVSYDYDEISSLETLRFHQKQTIKLSQSMDIGEAQLTFYKYLEEEDVDCYEAERLGNIADGGWNICTVPPYRLKKDNCIVYSFGINNDWSFDDAIADKYGCAVYSFDPSMDVGDHMRGQNIHFYTLGLYGHNHVNHLKWQMKTLAAIMEKLNHNQVVIDYLKMDIEYSEWASLKTAFTDGVLSNVKQLAMELHIPVDFIRASYFEKWELLNELEVQGFHLWDLEHNTYRTHPAAVENFTLFCCHNVYYINKRFLSPGFINQSLAYKDNYPEDKAASLPGYTSISRTMSTKEAEEIVFKIFAETQTSCTPNLLQGHRDLQEWDLCDSKVYHTDQPCLVYLLEQNQPSNFLGSVQRLLRCEYKKIAYSHRQVNESSLVIPLHHYGHGWSVQHIRPYVTDNPFNISAYMRYNRHSNLSLDIVYIDALHHSWELIQSLLQDPKFLQTKQLILTVYTKESKHQPSFVEDYMLYQRALRQLQKMNFLKWKTHECKRSRYKSAYTGKWRSYCWQMMYINAEYIK